MTLFKKFKSLRESHRAWLPAIQNPTDADIILAVAFAQESNRSIGARDLFGASPGTQATISRRLERLRRLGVIEQRLTADDGPRRHLVLSAQAYRRAEAFLRTLRQVLVR